MLKERWYLTPLSTDYNSLGVDRFEAKSSARKQGYVNLIRLLSSASRKYEKDIARRAALVFKYCIGCIKQALTSI